MEEEQDITHQDSELKKQFTTVTPLSKYLAMVIFVALPFLGFWVGYTNAPERVVEIEKIVVKETTLTNDNESKTVVGDEAEGLAVWQIYRDEERGFEFQYPDGYVVYKYVKDDFPSATGKCGATSRDDENGIDIVVYNKDFLDTHDIGINRIVRFEITLNDPEDLCVSGHYTGPTWGGKTLVSSENIEVNGQEVLKRNYVDGTNASDFNEERKRFKFSSWRFKKDETYITLTYNNGVTVDPEPQIEFFNEFLSKFKIIK